MSVVLDDYVGDVFAYFLSKNLKSQCPSLADIIYNIMGVFFVVENVCR